MCAHDWNISLPVSSIADLCPAQVDMATPGAGPTPKYRKDYKPVPYKLDQVTRRSLKLTELPVPCYHAQSCLCMFVHSKSGPGTQKACWHCDERRFS